MSYYYIFIPSKVFHSISYILTLEPAATIASVLSDPVNNNYIDYPVESENI